MSKAMFWDTNLLIYWIEQVSPWWEKMKALSEWQGRAGLTTVTSTISLSEILVRPVMLNNLKLARRYEQLITQMGCLPFGNAEAWAFAEIRAAYPQIRSHDAIQLACASVYGVNFFFANDNRLSSVSVKGIGRILSLLEWYQGTS